MHVDQISPSLELAARSAGRGLLSGAHTTERPSRVTYFRRAVMIERPPRQVFEFCLQAANVQAILPDPIELAAGTPLLGAPGGKYEFRHWMRGLIPVRWVVTIDRFELDREFVDHQLRGAFRWFRHTHSCFAADRGTLYCDAIEYATLLGPLLDRLVVRRELNRLFRYRHRRMRELLER